MVTDQEIFTGQAVSGSHGGSLLYLYAVLEETAKVRNLLESRRVPGLEPQQPLFSIEHHGLIAAVSHVPSSIFEEDPLNALLADLQLLAPFAVRHEEAIRMLLTASSSLVPMSFGAVYREAGGIRKFLEEKEDVLRSLLGQVRNRQEWGIKISLDNSVLLTAARESSDEVKRLSSQVATASPGRAYLISKQRDGILATESRRLLGEWLEAIMTALRSVSESAVVYDLPATGGTNADLVLKAAFLVPDEQIDAFHGTVEELVSFYSPRGLHIEADGPWAAYSFVGGVK